MLYCVGLFCPLHCGVASDLNPPLLMSTEMYNWYALQMHSTHKPT